MRSAQRNSSPSGGFSRRAFVRALGGGAGALGIAAAAPRAGAQVLPAGRLQTGVVRLGTVNTPEFSGLLDNLLPDFSEQSGLAVAVSSGEDVYQRARTGAFDLILSHYGLRDVEAFIGDGLGRWPRTVFANQQAIVGPAADPACVRGLPDATEAFRRIADSGSLWIVNNLAGVRYLEAILWEGAGRPERGAWYVDTGLVQSQAAQAAADQGAYTMWGVFPFLGFLEQRSSTDLEPLVLTDPLLQRIMVTVIVEPKRFPSANLRGALTLQTFLLTPATQARIRAFRYPGRDEQLWWPAGAHNDPAVLPGASGA